LTNDDVAIEGVSCLGRCDRAPAACLVAKGAEHENYYLGRSAEELSSIILTALKGEPPPPNHDSERTYLGAGSVIDPYQGESSDYRAVRAAIAARDASLRAAMETLAPRSGWTLGMLEKFRIAAIRQMRVDFEMETPIRAAVLAWQTENDWAKGSNLGGWSD